MKSYILYFSLLAIGAAIPLPVWKVNHSDSTTLSRSKQDQDLKKELYQMTYRAPVVATQVQKIYDKNLNTLQESINICINNTQAIDKLNSMMKNQIDDQFRILNNFMNETSQNDEIRKSVGWMAVPVVKNNIDEYLEKVKQTTKNFQEVMKSLVAANREIDRIKAEIPQLKINN